MRSGNTYHLRKLLLVLFLFIGFSEHVGVFAQTRVTAKESEKREEKIRLFIIGNSFSQNAARYLPDLAKERGYELEIGRAELGGCSLQRHWEIVEAHEADPEDPKGKQYKGKSLKMLLSDGTWDVVTIQQNSMNSTLVETYRPYAQKLYNYIKKLQPDAEVVMHQTWAYRIDSKDFGFIRPEEQATNAREMYEASRTAYHTIADELGIRLLPVGDAFWEISTHPKYAYRKDEQFNYEHPVYPNLPVQQHSLHKGYTWNKEHKLIFDSHHANAAGEFLGSLVWYAALFEDSPTKIKFVPGTMTADFANELKKTAKNVVRAATVENNK